MPRYTEEAAREAVAASLTYSEALRRLGLRPAGGNHRLFRKWVDEIWKIPTEHFDAREARRRALATRQGPIPLEEILVENSTYNRHGLKHRLYRSGLREPVCEMCGQDENWRGGVMAMILDHINGVPNDNRLENLRILCPNCAATLDTHCGRKNRQLPSRRDCPICGEQFVAAKNDMKVCSVECRNRYAADRSAALSFGRARPHRRLVERPPFEVLVQEVRDFGYLAVGRKYGVSDNAIRKWLRQYERELALSGVEGLSADEAA